MTNVTASAADEELVRQLTERARAEGLQSAGEGGLLQKLTKLLRALAVAVLAGHSPRIFRVPPTVPARPT